MVCFPNAKINIGLYVTEKRADGYHNLETIFLPIPFKDALEIISTTAKPTLNSIGLPIDVQVNDNLIWKAYQLLKRAYPDKVMDLNIILHKVIPMGAGLGGGSSDAAHALMLINQYYQLNISEAALLAYALQLGSDCPFFIKNTPQLAYGRGEILTPVAIPDLEKYSLELVLPELHVSTAIAFADMQPKPPNFNLKDIATLPITAWQGIIQNDFEQTVMKSYPVLQQIKDALIKAGAIYTAMTGTGAAIYAIVPKGEKLAFTCESISVNRYYIDAL